MTSGTDHGHDHDSGFDPETVHTAPFWDEYYGAREVVWSGRVNQRLAEQAGQLPPGYALDVGCGEGGDAAWLAAQGWRVLATDVSAVAVERARRMTAEQPGHERITWQPLDVLTWQPTTAEFDLVSMQFVHLFSPALVAAQARLARAVRPGGTLLIVNHNPLDLDTTMHRCGHRQLFATADETAADLDPALWQLELAEAQPRPATDQDGRPVTLHDTVVRATRRPE